jgi:hypothetical protein
LPSFLFCANDVKVKGLWVAIPKVRGRGNHTHDSW